MRIAAVLLVALLTLSTLSAQLSVEELLNRVDTWLAGYESAVSALVADERLVQSFRPQARTLGAYSRTIVSTFSFMRLPGDRAWLGLREARTVDGRDVTASGPGLIDLLKQPSESLATELAWRNARHNIGTPRTTNVPTLPLEVLHSRNRHRFKFSLEGSDRIRGMDVYEVRFVEHGRPTLISSLDKQYAVLLSGRVWIEPTVGRIRRAQLEARVPDERPEWTLGVEFEFDEKLSLVVPTELRETFFMPRGQGESRATYGNFRRFTTEARIVPPGAK
jgi:hypothetical protein